MQSKQASCAVVVCCFLVLGACREEAPGALGTVQLSLESPETFGAPFCVAIQVSAPASSPLRQERTYPAGTMVIETVFPNIPPGTDKTVELGIFRDGTCDATFDDADWYGKAAPVEVRVGEVTLVPMILRPGGSSATGGSIVIRGEAVAPRELHAEVVDPGSRPIPGATCEVLFEGASLGTAVSGAGASDLGIIDAELDTPPSAPALTLWCTHPHHVPTLKVAPWVPDAASPGSGTFATTVIMRPRMEILSSTTEALELRVNLAPVRLTEVQTPAGVFHRVTAEDPGVALKRDELSQPEVPLISTVVAVPVDGQASVEITPEGDGVEMSARLYPTQPDSPVPGGEGAPEERPVPFVFDRDAYLKGGVDVKQGGLAPLQETSDGNFVALRVPAASFDPRRLILTQFPSLRIRVTFAGRPCFRLERVADGYEMDSIDRRIEDTPSSLAAMAVNFPVLRQAVCPFRFVPLFFGARFIIITPPAFLAAANDLASHKRARGLSTVVVSTTTTGVTAASIRAYLQNAFTNWYIRPRYVLLMGDSEFIPTHYPGAFNFWDGVRNGGDQYYGQFGGGTTSVPCLGIGRFPVDTLAQAQAVVDKVEAFEDSPPTFFNSFYDDYTFAAQFQDDNFDGVENRTFARVSEIIRGHVTGQGWNVERIYDDSPTTSPTTWYDGVPVPWYLRKPTFPWDGNTADVLAAFNAGRALFFHRDHGWWNGWGTPGFSTGSLGSVSVAGTEFPVVLSINCASGIFDNESPETSGAGYSSASSTYWAEAFLRKSDGALAVIGDQRSSGSTINSDLARGLFDAIFPNLLAYGGPGRVLALGDVLNHGKGYLTTLGYDAASLGQQMTIYNLVGDPTVRFRLVGPLPIIVTSAALSGATLTAFIPPPVPQTGGPPVPPRPWDASQLSVVVVDAQGNVLGRGVPSPQGDVFVPVDAANAAGPLTAVVSGPDVLPQSVPLGR